MIDPLHFDKIIHERARLAILSALAAREVLSFGELKEHLGLSDGNLSINARVLEENGLILISKCFVGRKPHTTYSMTEEGRLRFQAYLTSMEEMVSRLKTRSLTRHDPTDPET